MAESEEKSDLDLPLHSNIEDIRVAHYDIDLTCDINNKLFRGNVLIVLSFEDESHRSRVESNRAEQVDRLAENDATECNKIDDERWNEDRQNLYHERCSNPVCDLLTEGSIGQLETNSSDNEYFKSSDVSDKIVERQQMSYCSNCQLWKTKCNDHQRTESKNEDNDRQKINNVGLQSDSQFEHSFVKDMSNMSANICTKTDTVPCDHTYSSQWQSNQSSENIMEKDNKDPENDMSKVLQDFVMVLDAWDLSVTSVQEIILNSWFDHSKKSDKTKLEEMIKICDTNSLEFCSEKTCLKFWKPGITSAVLFPRYIRISYQTQPCGPSLKWTKDQDGRPCVYTHGHWINNRSLFPSQDVPGALSTWQAHIHAPEGMTVLMSGDRNPEITNLLSDKDMKTYIYYTDLVVPSSTLALAVGYWEEVEVIPNTVLSVPNGQLPCRLFTPKYHKEIASTILHPYVPKCMESAAAILGSHPFKRLDILIVPASFASLGMASPSLMFLSQSVLSEDGHMLVRVAHELSHSWFGLSIGPRDWHEEWLSEGFSTYTEILIHGFTTKLTEDEIREEREIFDYLKYRTLQAELQSTDQDLQTLRKSKCDESKGAYVSNGMNPDKAFLQLHYLKGYFLLRHLEDTVGFINFKGFLKEFVEHFEHSLIDSMDVIQLFFKMFPYVRSESLSEDVLLRDWLNCPGLPKISRFCCLRKNKLNDEVVALEKRILDCHKSLTKLHWRKRRKLDIKSQLQITKHKFKTIQVINLKQKKMASRRLKLLRPCSEYAELNQVQMLMFLDKLIESEKVHHDIMQHLDDIMKLSFSNADVKHKWCELVIKHRFQEGYKDVEHFLVHHQAMGVYLYGELIISRDKVQRNLAEKVFTTISDDMEESVKKVVQTMIYGN